LDSSDDAYYKHAGFAAVSAHRTKAVWSLRAAIEGDSRYYERARTDNIFAKIKADIQALLDDRLNDVKRKAAEAIQQVDSLRTVVGTLLPDGQRRVLDTINEAEARWRNARTYVDYLKFPEFVGQIRSEIFLAETEKINQLRSDHERVEEEERKRIERDRLHREASEKEREQTLKKAGEWFKKSLGLAVLSYFLVGFGGCIVRAGSGKWIDFERGSNYDYPLYAWTNEAFYVAVCIVVIGIFGALIIAMTTLSKFDP
jgi:ElaB/YqjD/DUF883 family membrane-anchored ribosome-binding protein